MKVTQATTECISHAAASAHLASLTAPSAEVAARHRSALAAHARVPGGATDLTNHVVLEATNRPERLVLSHIL